MIPLECRRRFSGSRFIDKIFFQSFIVLRSISLGFYPIIASKKKYCHYYLLIKQYSLKNLLDLAERYLTLWFQMFNSILQVRDFPKIINCFERPLKHKRFFSNFEEHVFFNASSDFYGTFPKIVFFNHPRALIYSYIKKHRFILLNDTFCYKKLSSSNLIRRRTFFNLTKLNSH